MLAQYEEVFTANNDCTLSTKVNIKQKVDSQLALVHEAIRDKCVTLTAKQQSSRLYYVVLLFPKENCSCLAEKMCYHLLSCKVMTIGRDLHDDTKLNYDIALRQKNKEKYPEEKLQRKKIT